MTNPTILALEGVAAPLAESLGLSIWGIEVLGENRPIVRIYVEGEGGADIDQCAELSRLLGLSLDVEDIMPGAYSLEISTPGLERLFFTTQQLETYVGRTVQLMLVSPEDAWPGRKKFQGVLQSVVGDTITLLPDDTPPDTVSPLITLWQNIHRARLVHDFNANKGVKRSAAKARS